MFTSTPTPVARPSGLDEAPYQLISPEGGFDAARIDACAVPAAQLLALYRGMLRIRLMDERLLTMQRQGRISFYGEARGQEAAVVGTAAALGADDYIVPALREAGAALYRGLPLSAYIAQIFGNDHDLTRGRQMPCHPGSRAARYVTMSSCIGTQLPHATGMAMAAQRLNFAGVFRAPVVFVCQNNQWAISTPVSQQTASPTMAEKALAYGLPAVRCDGNDVLACYVAMRALVDRARRGEGPQFLEALTYRVSAHSSSDDPSRYRDESVTAVWREARCPLSRFRAFLLLRGLLSVEGDTALREELDAEVRAVISAEESVGPPPLRSLVEDVFAQVPAHLAEQLAEVAAALPAKPAH
jgi:pyruvate dehydrogenase E1 component alpha subunit/2-oxoisovalerate dehydrogenase E1 component alpha subunit